MREDEEEVRRGASEWLSAPTAYDDLFVLYTTLLPEMSCMRAVLEASDEEWEMMQHLRDHDGEQRHFHILDFHFGLHILPALRSGAVNLESAELWEFLPQHEGNASLIFRLTMRVAAAIYTLLWNKVQGFPFAIFKLIADPTQATELLARPQCMREGLARHVFHFFPTEELLSSEECRQYLSGIAHMLKCHTYSAERLHSRNSRRARARVQSHRCTLPFIAMPHTNFAAAPLTQRLHFMDGKDAPAVDGPARPGRDEALDRGAGDVCGCKGGRRPR